MISLRNRGALDWTGVVAGLAFALMLLPASGGPARAQTPAPSGVVRLLGVGGVLTADGTIWQYRPDRGRWQTIDESFHDQGKDTHVLPLPVSPGSIREMVTFGFLLTDTGECWLYDLNKDKWQKLPPPPASH